MKYTLSIDVVQIRIPRTYNSTYQTQPKTYQDQYSKQNSQYIGKYPAITKRDLDK